MEEEFRDPRIDITGNIAWGTYFCQFYETKEDLTDIIPFYLKLGLKNSEFCVWIKPHFLNMDEAKEMLRMYVPDIEVYLEKGQIEIISHKDWFLKNDTFDSEKVLNNVIEKINQASDTGYNGLRLAEDICWLEKESYNNFFNYEKKVNSLTQEFKAKILHTYQVEKFNTADIIEIAANHQFTLIKKDGEWKRIENSAKENIVERTEESERFRLESQNVKSRLETVLKYLPVGVIIADAPSGKLLMGNEWVKKIFRGNLPLSSSVEEYGSYIGFHPDGRQYTEEEWPLARAVRNGEVVIGEEIEFQLTDGTRRMISVSAAPIRDEKGRITNGVVVDEDITLRKQSEEALRKSEEQYKMLFTNMTEGFLIAEVICDKNNKPCDYRYLEINPAFERVMGIKGEYVLGKSVLEVFPNASSIAIENLAKVAVSGKSTNFEIFSQVADKHFDVYAFSPEKGRIATIFRDITKRKEAEAKVKDTLDNLENLVKGRTTELEKAYTSLKESEERYRIVVERTGQLVYDYDLKADIGHWAGAIEEITGYTPEEFQKFDRLFWIENVHPDDREQVVKNIREARKTGKTFQEEFRFRKKDGSYIYIEDSGAILLDEKGNAYRSLGVNKDITEKKEAEETLAKIEEARIKEIHHRIKNNLQVISSLLDLQAETFSHLETCKTPDVIEAFLESQNRVISMALIHEELYKSKGIDSLDFSDYLKKLTKELFRSYNLRNEDISLKMELEQAYLGMDTAIPLGIIVNELVSNSLKHAFPGEEKGEIKISLEKAENPILNEDKGNLKGTFSRNKENLEKSADGDSGRENTFNENNKFSYILKVSDTGKGIPEEIDFQGTNSLGFQLVKILVEQIDGCIKLGKANGTEFTIWFNNMEK